MMKRTGNDTSRSWSVVAARCDAYVKSVNRTQTLDPAGKVFIALAGSQAARSIGCSLRELCLLTSLRKSEVKRGLSWLMSYGLIRLGPTRFALPTSSGLNRIHYPSDWVRGKIFERRSGPRVPLYELGFDRELVIEAIGKVAKFDVSEFFDRVKAEVSSKSTIDWEQYRAFADIVLHDLASVLRNVMNTYEEYMPHEVKTSFKRLIDALPVVEADCREQSQVLDLLGKLKGYFSKPLSLSLNP
jgi:hypothetical protein